MRPLLVGRPAPGFLEVDVFFRVLLGFRTQGLGTRVVK